MDGFEVSYIESTNTSDNDQKWYLTEFTDKHIIFTFHKHINFCQSYLCKTTLLAWLNSVLTYNNYFDDNLTKDPLMDARPSLVGENDLAPSWERLVMQMILAEKILCGGGIKCGFTLPATAWRHV